MTSVESFDQKRTATPPPRQFNLAKIVSFQHRRYQSSGRHRTALRGILPPISKHPRFTPTSIGATDPPGAALMTTTPDPPVRKKLIEVSIPLEEIDAESAREKSIRHGHPSTLHLWWARRPLAAARAVLFAQLVDDPSSDPSLSEEQQKAERERLHNIIRRLVKWENINNDAIVDV